MLRWNYRKFSFLITTAFVLACVAPSLAPASSPVVPSFDPNSAGIAIAQTSNAAATQTAQMAPATLIPTITLASTNTATETATPTFLFILPTSTVPTSTPTIDSSGAEYSCRIDSQSPADNGTFGKGAEFDAIWQVINTGTKTWDTNDTDYRYVSGDKFHKTKAYDLNKSVSPGGTVAIGVRMQAPTDPGTYSTTWKINIGKNQFCAMKLTIIVSK